MTKTRVSGMTYAAQGLRLPASRMQASARGPLIPNRPVRVGMYDDQSLTPFPNALPLRQGPRQVDTGISNYFEALSPSHDRTQIPLFVYALRSVLQTFNRVQLLFLARYLYDNDGLVSYAVNTIASYSTPIKMMAATPDPVVNALHNDYFDEWGKRADFSGRFDFDTLQWLCSIACDVDGDMLPVMTMEHGFPQVQLLEGWRVDSRALANSINNTRLIDGVRLDRLGVVEGFYVVNAMHNFMVGLTPPEFVPASTAILLGDPERYSSQRYYSPLRRGSNDIRDAKDIKGFEKLATKIHAALAAVIEGGGFEEEDVWGNDTTDVSQTGQSFAQEGNLPPADATQQEKKFSIWEMLGGDIPILPDGKKLHQIDNNRPGARIPDFLSYLGTYMIAGLNLPPAFIINGGLTGPGERSVNGKAQRKFDRRQALVARFGEWAWVRVIGHGIATRAIPAAPNWNKPEWQGPPKVSIDEGRDAQAWREDFANGLMTRENHFGNRARNWQRETDQGMAEDDYIFGKAREIADKHNVPIETVLIRWGYNPQKVSPAKTEGSQTETEENKTTKKTDEATSQTTD